MPKIKDLNGKVFGRLTVVERAAQNLTRRPAWLCKCSCGRTTVVRGLSLRAGATTSCGCYTKELNPMRNFRHGHSPAIGSSAEYKAWNSMIQRCTNAQCTAYAAYGARGIGVCDEWRDFANFLRDMGARPPGHSLDRKDNGKGYSPSNCHWATRKQQQRNRRTNRYIEWNGETLTLIEWSEKTGLSTDTIRNRLRSGWRVEHALTVPSDDKHLSVARNAKRAAMAKEKTNAE